MSGTGLVLWGVAQIAVALAHIVSLGGRRASSAVPADVPTTQTTVTNSGVAPRVPPR